MKKVIPYFFGLVFLTLHSVGQAQSDNVIYIIDSIPVIEDPEEGNEINNEDIADVNIIKNKDTLRTLGYGQLDGAIYIFTKEYRKRSDELKLIPSSRQMEKKGSVFYFRGNVYTGKFIDYYYSGRKQGEGTFVNGKAEGQRLMFHQNGKISLERQYSNGIENGEEKEYYEDGSLKQKGQFVNGRENGVWEMYFPNGQVKQRSNFQMGQMEGETVVYYSTGKILTTEITKNGKTTPDKKLERVEQSMNKGHASNKEGDYKNAIKHYSKAIELDSEYAEAYFARGTVKLNDFQFDEALLDFDLAIKYEPYFERALTNRAFTRIRKSQFGSSRKLSQNNGVTVLASKDNPGIPEKELELICNDLKLAIFLGDRGKMITDAYKEFCEKKSNR